MEKETKKNIEAVFYEKTDEQKKRHIEYVRKKIRQGNDPILHSMMDLVETHLKKYHADFYVHDISLYWNTKGTPFLWIVREYGTHFVDLYSEKFLDNEVWDAKSYFNAILLNSKKKIKGIYLIENGKMQKLSEESALATLAIKESIVRKNLECAI